MKWYVGDGVVIYGGGGVSFGVVVVEVASWGWGSWWSGGVVIYGGVVGGVISCGGVVGGQNCAILNS